jgi:DNA-binding NarL/FixJ family response regulator
MSATRGFAAPLAGRRRGRHVDSSQGEPSGAITLALIGGPRLLREATASLLGTQHGLRVTGTYESAAHFLAVGADDPPAVLLLDCDEDDPESWARTVDSLRSADVRARMVMLCEEMCDDAVRCAIEHGLSGVILKSYPTSEVRAAIEYMATGRTVMPSGWQAAAAKALNGALQLSPRQHQILALIADGCCNDAIAAQLGVSPNTIKFHIRSLYSRLDVHNRVEAANRYAQMSRGEG